MGLEGEPHVSRQGRISQASYSLPQRVNTSKVYPVKSPNGSTVIVYGHANGISVIWRGGRRLRDTGSAEAIGTESSDGNDAFESEEEDTLLTAYFQQPIIHHSDVPLGVAVLHLSIPSIPLDTSTSDIIIAAACADRKVRLVKIPVSPEVSQKEHSTGRTRIAMIDCSAETSSVTTTFTSREDKDLLLESSEVRNAKVDLDLLVAICSKGGSGRLTITRIPLDFDAVTFKPFYNQILRGQAQSVSFNPSLYPSSRHTQLMVSFAAGSISIFDPFLKPQRGLSTEYEGPRTRLGAWLITLTTSFATQPTLGDSVPSLCERKEILDAQWVINGQSIIALLTNGQWGIWDLGSSLEDPECRAEVSKSTFVATGFLTSVKSAFSQDPIRLGPKKPRGSRSSLAPMTPNSRNAKTTEFFHRKDDENTMGPPKGGLSILAYPAPSGGRTEESVMLWYNESMYIIPSLRSYCARVSKTANVGVANGQTPKPAETGGSLFGPGLTKVSGLRLNGENLLRASALPDTKASRSSSLESRQADILVTTETRLLFLASKPARVDIANAFENRLRGEVEQEQDQQLLAHGALDLGGVDRLLNGMNGSIFSPTKKVVWGQNEEREFNSAEKLGL